MKNHVNSIVTISAIVVLFLLFTNTTPNPRELKSTIPYSAFLEKVHANQVSAAYIDETNKIIYFETIDQEKLKAVLVTDPGLIGDLIGSNVEVLGIPPERPGIGSMLLGWFPFLLLAGVTIWFMRAQLSRMNGGGGGGNSPFTFGKNKSRTFDSSTITVTFKDVAGCDEAKEEVTEIVEFLRNPAQFTDIGGKIPRGVLMVGPPGTGKAQPLDAPVKVPGGWKMMGDIKSGDVVSTPDGKTASVISVHPQGMKDVYKITFDDGTFTECCIDHLWQVFSTRDWGQGNSRLMTTGDLLNKMQTTKVPHFHIPLAQPVENPKNELPINPYLLGVLLGDGSFTLNRVCFSTNDEHILNKVKTTIDKGYEVVHNRFYDYTITYTQETRHQMNVGRGVHGNYLNTYLNRLYDLGLLGSYSQEKFIPDIYFNACIEDRLSLLQGLMDTDGTVGKGGSVSFTTTSFELADGVRALVQSLGGKATISSVQRNYTYRGETKQGQLSYDVHISIQHPEVIFSLPRKVERAINVRSDNRVVLRRKIVNIEKLAQQKEMQCIYIDHPDHLYLTNSYIVTHNTLLARAIANEAGVPFLSADGSGFVEMFVGVGASRVRDLFAEAKKKAPCIVFLDEIDAVGRKRGSGVGGGNDEREQTLNALLVEMDGFEQNDGVIVVAATNRPDVLDKALLRPGRFDRQVTVSLPDIKGREQILDVHARKIAMDGSANISAIARGTPGFSGADLANLVNEAALMAARGKRRTVTNADFEKAKDKIMMGTERRTMVMSDQEKRLTAYHEAGHAIVGCTVPDHDPVHKVSIIPRGRALGVTMYLPEDDRVSYTKEHLESMLSSLYGGRVAEEIVFGSNKVTTGASNDIERATSIATNMVKRWGFSNKLGPLAFVEDNGSGFLGQDTQDKRVAGSTSETIDAEIKDLIEQNYKRTEIILKENMDKLHTMAEALLKYETIDANMVRAIMNGATLSELEILAPEAPKAPPSKSGVSLEEKQCLLGDNQE